MVGLIVREDTFRSIFMYKVMEEENQAPGYYQKIPCPMHFLAIAGRLCETRRAVEDGGACFDVIYPAEPPTDGRKLLPGGAWAEVAAGGAKGPQALCVVDPADYGDILVALDIGRKAQGEELPRSDQDNVSGWLLRKANQALKRCKEGHRPRPYSCCEEALRDLLLIGLNCQRFNGPGHVLHNTGARYLSELLRLWHRAFDRVPLFAAMCGDAEYDARVFYGQAYYKEHHVVPNLEAYKPTAKELRGRRSSRTSKYVKKALEEAQAAEREKAEREAKAAEAEKVGKDADEGAAHADGSATTKAGGGTDAASTPSVPGAPDGTGTSEGRKPQDKGSEAHGQPGKGSKSSKARGKSQASAEEKPTPGAPEAAGESSQRAPEESVGESAAVPAQPQADASSDFPVFALDASPGDFDIMIPEAADLKGDLVPPVKRIPPHAQDVEATLDISAQPIGPGAPDDQSSLPANETPGQEAADALKRAMAPYPTQEELRAAASIKDQYQLSEMVGRTQKTLEYITGCISVEAKPELMRELDKLRSIVKVESLDALENLSKMPLVAVHMRLRELEQVFSRNFVQSRSEFEGSEDGLERCQQQEGDGTFDALDFE